MVSVACLLIFYGVMSFAVGSRKYMDLLCIVYRSSDVWYRFVVRRLSGEIFWFVWIRYLG